MAFVNPRMLGQKFGNEPTGLPNHPEAVIKKPSPLSI
jgi:hypothetical protein